MALSGAIGAFYGASLTKNVSINLLLILIGLIIFYESFTLLKDNNRNNKININNNEKKITENRLNVNQKSIKQKNPYNDIIVQSIIGFLIGLLGGLVGLVLGSIRLPAMIKI